MPQQIMTIELKEVKPIYSKIYSEKINGNPPRQTGFYFSFKHEEFVHTLTIPVSVQIREDSREGNLILEMNSETIFEMKSTENSIFYKPVQDNLMKMLTALIKLAIAHNRGMYELLTENTLISSLKVRDITDQEIETKIRFEIDKELLAN